MHRAEQSCAYEHPEYGVAIITWTWLPVDDGGWSWIPVSIEWDLFTPPGEQTKLEALLWAGRQKPPSAPPTGTGQAEL
jgi:hypothetical protein